jgi:hypothetical protein
MFERYFRLKVAPRDFDKLLFGQQHAGTKDFFNERMGQYHTIPVRSFPHFQFLENHLGNPYGDSPYSQYLYSSWQFLRTPQQNTPESRTAKITQFLDLYGFIQHEGRINDVIPVYRRPDGKFVLVDGNHRAAIALKLGLPITLQLIKPEDFIRRTCLIPGEYTTTSKEKLVCQSIIYRTRQLVRGTGIDARDRFQLIDKQDIKGKDVLDIGCKLGANCYAAAQMGAVSVVGFDSNPRLISAAVRMNAYFSAPCDFITGDLPDIASVLRPAHTTFYFSPPDGDFVMNKQAAAIQHLTLKVLYFEGHSGFKMEDHPTFRERSLFARVDLMGYVGSRIGNRPKDHPLFRCEVA